MAFNCQADLNYYEWPQCGTDTSDCSPMNSMGLEYDWAIDPAVSGGLFPSCCGYNGKLDNEFQCNNVLTFQNDYNPCPCNGYYQTDGDVFYNIPMWTATAGNLSVGNGYCCRYYESSEDNFPSTCGDPIDGVEGACSCLNGPQGNMCNDSGKVGIQVTTQVDPQNSVVHPNNAVEVTTDCYCDPECEGRGDCCKVWICEDDGNGGAIAGTCELKNMRDVECVPIIDEVYGCMDVDASNFYTQPACNNEGFCEDTLLSCTPGGDTSNCGDSAICYPGCPDGCVEGECPDTPVTEMCEYEGCMFYCLKEDNPFWCQSEESTWRFPFGDGETPWPSGVPCPCPGDAVNYTTLISQGFTLFTNDDITFTECNLCSDNDCTLHSVSQCNPVYQNQYKWFTDEDNDGIGCCEESTFICPQSPVTYPWAVQTCEETQEYCNCPSNEFDQCGICGGSNQCVGCLDPLSCNYKSSYTNDCSGTGNGAPGYDFGGGEFVFYADIIGTMYFNLFNMNFRPDHDPTNEALDNWGARAMSGCGQYGLSSGAITNVWGHPMNQCQIRDHYLGGSNDCGEPGDYNLPYGACSNPDDIGYMSCQEAWESQAGDAFDDSWDLVCLSGKLSSVVSEVFTNYSTETVPNWNWESDWDKDVEACTFYLSKGGIGSDLPINIRHPWLFSESKASELCNIFALGTSFDNPGKSDPPSFDEFEGLWINYRSINTFHYRKVNYTQIQGSLESCSQDYSINNENCNGIWLGVYGDTTCCEYTYPGSESYPCGCSGDQPLDYYNDTNDWDGFGCPDLSAQFCEGEEPPGWVLDNSGSCEQCPSTCDGQGGGIGTGTESCYDDCGVCYGSNYCSGTMDFTGGTCDGVFVGSDFDCAGVCFGDSINDLCGICGGSNFEQLSNCCLDTENPDNCRNKVWITYPDGTSIDNAILIPGDSIDVKVQIYSIDNPVESISTRIASLPGQNFSNSTSWYEDETIQYIGDGVYQVVHNYVITENTISGPSGFQDVDGWDDINQWMNTKFRVEVKAKEALYQCGDSYLGNDPLCELPDGTLCEPCDNVGIDFEIEGQTHWNQLYTWWDSNTLQEVSCGIPVAQVDCAMGFCTNGNLCYFPDGDDITNCGDQNPYCNPGPCWDGSDCTIGYASFMTGTWDTGVQPFLVDGGPDLEVNQDEGFPIVINSLYQDDIYDESTFRYEWIQTDGVTLSYDDNADICNGIPNCRWFQAGVPGIRNFDLIIKDSQGNLLGQTDLKVTVVGQNRSTQLQAKNRLIKSKESNFIDNKLRKHDKQVSVKSSPPLPSLNPNLDDGFLNCLYQFPDFKFGDVDNNGQINVTDIVKIINNIDDLSFISECAPFFADVNQDGVVDSSDVFSIVENILNQWNRTNLPTDDIYQQTRTMSQYLGCPSKYPQLLNNGEPYINHDWDCWDEDGAATSCNGCYDIPEGGWPYVCQDDIGGSVYQNDPGCGGTNCTCIIRPDYVCKLDPNGDTYYPIGDETCDVNGYRNPLCGTDVVTPIMELGCVTAGMYTDSFNGDCADVGDGCNWTEMPVPIYELQCGALGTDGCEYGEPCCGDNASDGDPCFWGIYSCGQVQVGETTEGNWAGTCEMVETGSESTPYECTTQCKTFGIDSNCDGQCPGEHTGNYCIDKLEHCCLHDFPKKWTDTFNYYLPDWNGLPDDYEMNFKLMRCSDESLSTCQNVGDLGPDRFWENPSDPFFGEIDTINTTSIKSPYGIPIVSIFGAECSDGDRLIDCSQCNSFNDCDIRGILPRFESLPPVGYDTTNFQHVANSETHNQLVTSLGLTAGSTFYGYICEDGPYQGQACQTHYGSAGIGCGTELNDNWEGWENQVEECEEVGSCSWSCVLNPLTQGPPTIYQKLVRGTHYDYGNGTFDDGDITMHRHLYWDNPTFPVPYLTWDGSSSLDDNVPSSLISNNPYPKILNDGGDGNAVDTTPIYSLSIKNKVNDNTHEKIYLKLYDPFYEQEYPLGCMKILAGGNYGVDGGINEIKYHIYSDVNLCGGSQHDGLYQGVCSHDTTINCENNIDCRIKVSVVTNGGDSILSPSKCFQHGCTDADGSGAVDAGYPHHPDGQPACNYDAEAEVDDGSCYYRTKWYHDFDNDELTNCDSAFVVQCEEPENYYQCDCCDSGDCSSDPVCNDPNDYCQSNVIDDCGVCDGPDYCNGSLEFDDNIGAIRCICDPGTYPCWTTNNDISSCDSSIGFDCRGVCGTGWVTDPCGIGAPDGSMDFSISAGFGGNCVPCFDRDGDGDGLDYNKISCRLDFDKDGHPCDDNLGDSTCVNTYMCPGYNAVYDVYDECPCPVDSDGTNCYQLADGTYASDPNDTCEYGYWDSCGHCSSQESDITLYSDCRDNVECFSDQNGHKTDDCGNCMTMTCCNWTIDGSCPQGDYIPSWDGDGWRLANGNYIFNNPCADIWGSDYIPGNLNWNVGCVDCGGLYGGENISDTTGICDFASDGNIKCNEEDHCCLPGAVDNCGVCNSAGILNTEYIFFRDWDRDGIPYAENHDFVCVKSDTIGGVPSIPNESGTYVVHGHTPSNPFFDGGFNDGGINLVRYEMCSNPTLEGSSYTCYDDTNWDCPEGLEDDCNGECGGDAIVDECGVCNGDGYNNYYVNLGNLGIGWGTPLQHCTGISGEPDVSWLGSCMSNSSWTQSTNNNEVLQTCMNPQADNYICNLYPCLSGCEDNIQGSVIATMDTPFVCAYLNLLLPDNVELSGYSFGVQINGGNIIDSVPCTGTEFDGSTCWNNIDVSGTHSSYGQFARIRIYELTESGGSVVGEPIENVQIPVDSETPFNFNTSGDYTCDCGDGLTFECECYEVGKYYRVVALYPDPEDSSVSQSLRDLCSEENNNGCVGYDVKEFLFDSSVSGCSDNGSLPSCQTVCDVTNNQCVGGPCIGWEDPDNSLLDNVFSGDEVCSSFTEGQYCDSTSDCQSYAEPIHYQNCFPNRPPTKEGTFEPYGTDEACDYDSSVNVQTQCTYKKWVCSDSDGDGYGCSSDRRWECSPYSGYIDCDSGYTESSTSACQCSAESSIIDRDPNHRVMWGSFELGMESFGYVNGDWLDSGSSGYDSDTIPGNIYQFSSGQCLTGPNIGEDIYYGDGTDLYNLCPSDINPISNMPYMLGETIPGFVDNCEICMDPMCAPAGLGVSKEMYDVDSFNPNNFIDLYVYGWNNEQWGAGQVNNPCSIYDDLDQWGNGFVPTNPNWNKSCTGCTDPNSSNYNPNATRPCTGAVRVDGLSLNGELTEFHDNPNPTCPGRCQFNPNRKCQSDDDCFWSSPCDDAFSEVSYGTCNFGDFVYEEPDNGIPVFEEYIGQTISPQGPNCCCETLAVTCPDPCSPDYEPGTTTDCLGNQLKDCLFGYNDSGQAVDTMFSGIILNLSGGSNVSENSLVDSDWPQEWPLNVNEGDYIRVGEEVMQIESLSHFWPLMDTVSLTLTRGLFGTNNNSSYSNKKVYVEHPSFCNYQCCQPYEVEACMDPDAINYYCWGYYGFLINDYRLCPEYGKVPNCDIETYGDLCENVIDGTSNDNWERKLVKPCGGDNSCCQYQHDCSGELCNGRECDKRTNNSWFDFCGNCITTDLASTEGWANIGCGCNPTLGSEGNEPPVYYLDSDMDGFGCANLILTPNVASELTMMYQQYGLNLGNCLSDPSKKCFGMENDIHLQGECGTGGGSSEDCEESTGQYLCDDGSGVGIFVDGSDCAGFNWSWEYCDQPPRWYIKEDTVMGHSETTEGRTDLWWYNLEEDGQECNSDEDCAIHNPQLWECWITQGEGCDLMPVQEGICEDGHCQHPGWQGAHETMPLCMCQSNDYDCEGNCVTPENENPPRFDSCNDCGGTTFGCSRNVCKYQGMSICFTNGQPDETNFIGDGVECEDYCCTGEGDCNGEFQTYWIYRGERTVIPCVEAINDKVMEIPLNDTCNMETGYCTIQNEIECENHNFCKVHASDFLWSYTTAAQSGLGDDDNFGGLKDPDTEPGYHNEAFYCDFYHPEFNPSGNPLSNYDCNCECGGSAYLDDCGVCVNIPGVTTYENNITECKLQAGCEYNPEIGQYCENFSINNVRYASKSFDDRGEGFQNWIADGFGSDLDCNCDCKPHTLKGRYITGEASGVPQDQIIPWYGTAHIDFPMGDDDGMGSSNIYDDNLDEFVCGSEYSQPYLCNLSCGCSGGNTLPSYKRIMETADTTGDGLVDTIYNPNGLGHKHCFSCFDSKAPLGYDPIKYSHCIQFGGPVTCFSASPPAGDGYTCAGAGENSPSSGLECNPLDPSWMHPEGCGECRQKLSIYAEDVACQSYGCQDRYSLNYEPLSWGGLRCIDSWLFNKGDELYQWPVQLETAQDYDSGKPWELVDIREPEYAGYSIQDSLNEKFDYVMGTPTLVDDDGDGVVDSWAGDGQDGGTIRLGGVIKSRDWADQPSLIPDNYLDELYQWLTLGTGDFEDFFNDSSQIQEAGINYSIVKDGQAYTANWVDGVNSTIWNNWDGYCGSGGDGSLTDTECSTLFPNDDNVYQCVPEFLWAEGQGCEEHNDDEETCNNTNGCHFVHVRTLCDNSGTCKWKLPYFGWDYKGHLATYNGKIGIRGVAAMGLLPACDEILVGLNSGRSNEWNTWDDHEIYHWHSIVLGGGSDIQGKYNDVPGGSQFPNLPDAMWKLGIMKKHHDFVFRMQIPEMIMFQGFDDNTQPNITDLVVTFGDTNRYQNPAIFGESAWPLECDPSDSSVTVIFSFEDLGQDIYEMLAGNINIPGQGLLTNQPFTVRAGYEGGSITFENGDQLISAQVSTCTRQGESIEEMLQDGFKNAVISVRKHHAKPDVTCVTSPNDNGYTDWGVISGAVLDKRCGFEYNDIYNNAKNRERARRGVVLKPSSHHKEIAQSWGFAAYGTCSDYNDETSQNFDDAYCGGSVNCPTAAECAAYNNMGAEVCESNDMYYSNNNCICGCSYTVNTTNRKILKADPDEYDCSLGSWGFYNDQNYSRGYNYAPHQYTDASYDNTWDNFIWLDNFRLQSARKTGMLGMLQVNRLNIQNQKFGESKRDYCCRTSWCGGWDGDWCEDCICEDNHSVWDNSFELSFFDDSKSCGITLGNPSFSGCPESTDEDGIDVSGYGTISSYNNVYTRLEEDHPRHVIWKYTDEKKTYVDNCGSDGGSSGRNQGHLQNYGWQPGDWVQADMDCNTSPGSHIGGERYGLVGGDFAHGCGKPTTFQLWEFPNLADPCYDFESACGSKNTIMSDGEAGWGQPDGNWCVDPDPNLDGSYLDCWSSQACEGTCTPSPYERWKDQTDETLKPDFIGSLEGKSWPEIVRRWDTELDFLTYWNEQNYAAAESVLDDYWNDDGFYWFVVKAEGSQGFYTTSDGGDVHDWFSSQVNNLANCGTWCMGGWKRKSSYTAFPVSKKLIKNAWTSTDPKPVQLIWANAGNSGKSNRDICNDVYFETETVFDTTKTSCYVFDIPGYIRSDKGNTAGGTSSTLPSHTSCGGGHWLEGGTNHTWNTFPPNWSSTNDSLWTFDSRTDQSNFDDEYNVAFAVTVWPPSYVHSSGVDWTLQPFGDS